MTKKSRATVIMLTAMLLPACTSWRPTAAGPGDVIPAERPSAVRLTLADGSVETVRSPVLRNDSIVSADLARPGGVPRAAVVGVEVRRVSVGRTLGMAAAGVAGAALWTVAATGSGGSGGDPDPVPKLGPGILQGIAWLASLIR